MHLKKVLMAIALAACGSPASADEPGANKPGVARLFSYTLTNRAAFEAGYRKHLGWHADRHDRLVWYAWYVTEGDRRGSFIDGTFGTTPAELDARPDPEGDAADFRASAGPFAQASGITSWSLWPQPTTATPLELRHPGDRLIAFFVTVKAGQVDTFEAAANRLAKTARGIGQVSWYRSGNADTARDYMLLFHGASDGALPILLRSAYHADPDTVVDQIDTVRAESWRYVPRLSLIPGQPLVR
ncbi:hypothetical protein G4G27_09865 [Sphingomonas sp. So64.6b]|uniref:hypothetical protein n=1 Tax=Sphingomonas sp. So64.6b TaxID=2997354 RepID=UPI0016015DB5|nr:hypothetical protein [Sphingomonas sp. So64.6b]QNA84258.1 hypothetical protein G4G27_09865 [Sphingomonas sp. So64.6b]